MSVKKSKRGEGLLHSVPFQKSVVRDRIFKIVSSFIITIKFKEEFLTLYIFFINNKSKANIMANKEIIPQMSLNHNIEAQYLKISDLQYEWKFLFDVSKIV